MKIVQTNIVSSTPADVNVNISGHGAISVCVVTEPELDICVSRFCGCRM